MTKQTLMIFAHPSCNKKAKVSFQSVATEIDDLESGMAKVSENMDSGNLKHGQIIPLWGYVHVSKEDTSEDLEWDITPLEADSSITEDSNNESQSTDSNDSTDEDEDIPF